MGSSLSNHNDMPQPTPLTEQEKLTQIFRSENFNITQQEQLLAPKLNVEEMELYEAVYQAVHAPKEDPITRQFIVNAPAGFGKTFNFKVIAAKIRAEHGIVLCVGSTGLAAQNLEGGKTAHSRFRIPIPIFQDSVCAINAESSLAKLIKESNLIIWDEIFSVNRFNVECVERSLRDLMRSQLPWGGKTVLLGGDPRQILLRRESILFR